MTTTVEVRRGTYYDSVSLMQVSRIVGATDGVEAALVAMGTELNVELLAGMGFSTPAGVGPNDMMIAVGGGDDADVARGVAAAEAALSSLGRGAAGSEGALDEPPRTVASAAARDPEATVALVSVPGRAAVAEAMDALEAGLPVMVFSDNVPLEQEVRLKEEAARRGLLVMGPDCGTAVIGGVGLGFANVVQPGPVGIVAASGTGAQQLMCLLDGAGVGMSHCLGLGGRDLSAPVKGRSARQALRLLDDDPATELIVIVSKPADPQVAEELTALAETLSTPVQEALLGRDATDLTSAARQAVHALGRTWVEPRTWSRADDRLRSGALLRGLFAGGTLRDEAVLIAAASLDPSTFTMTDFGDDELTAGRPHPMIDQSLRLEALQREAREPDVGVLLLDVVLGHGAHPDPAAELAPAIGAARARRDELAVVVSLCGTSGDPQGLERQAERLHDAGASVYLSNAAAAEQAVRLAGKGA